jgi:thiol-disulfide isomerase/thioredoxin
VDPAVLVEAPATGDDFRSDPPARVGGTGRPQFLDFFAEWCRPCYDALPITQGMEADYWGRVDFSYLDIERADMAPVVARYGLTGRIPVYIFVDEAGNELQRWYYIASFDEMTAAFDAYLAGADQNE